MSDYPHAVNEFYQKHLTHQALEKSILSADCPFCQEKGFDGSKKLVVIFNRDGYFHGYFRCLNRCVPGGFPLWFSALAKIDPAETPGFTPNREPYLQQAELPVQTINQDIKKYQDNHSERTIARFQEAGISKSVLQALSIGYNGRYIVYPYIQDDGNCYTARCVFPDRPEDYFWHGDAEVVREQFQIFNVQDIGRCENGALVICEGENNLLPIKQMGLPGIAIPDSQLFEVIDVERFAHLRTIFIATLNNSESEARARSLASRIGHKIRILTWPPGLNRNYSLWDLAQEKGAKFSSHFISMVRHSKAFSPFKSPNREYDRFFSQLDKQKGEAYANLTSGFERLDEKIDGIHGLNIIGGAPKIGKSCFLIQIGTEMARRRVPVIYYDFENGRQKILQRTMVRMSRLSLPDIQSGSLVDSKREAYSAVCKEFRKMMNWFRIVNDRKVTPEIMRRHIDFIRHETQSDYPVVIIDSLHKLPFKDFNERRSGIDAWLRQLESIRDEMQVSFLVISELSRGDKGSYRDTPHMGVFKDSGDIEYSADNALVLFPDWSQQSGLSGTERSNNLWLVASREYSPGLVGTYRLDYPYWSFLESDKE